MASCSPAAGVRRPLGLWGLGLVRFVVRSMGQLASGLSQLIWLAGYLGLAALLFPSLLSLADWTREREHYEHFPLLVAAAVGLAAIRFYSESPRLGGYSGYGHSGSGHSGGGGFFGGSFWFGRISARVLFWTGLAVALTAGVYLLPSRWLAGVAAWCLIAAAVAFLGGQPLTRLMAGPLLLLAAAIPLPVNLDRWLIVEMQHLATRLASLWLDLAGVLHFTSGVAIQTPAQDFFVEDACSGIHSLFAAIAVGVGYGVFCQYRLLRVAALVLQMIFWVVVANAVRVFLTVYGQAGMELETAPWEAWGLKAWGFGDVNLDADDQHSALGLATFAAGIGLALCGDAFLRYLIPLRGDSLQDRQEEWQRAERPMGWFDRSLPAWGVVIPGIGAIACAVAVSGPPAAATAAVESVWERVAVPRPEAGWGTLEEVYWHAVRHWREDPHPGPLPQAGEGARKAGPGPLLQVNGGLEGDLHQPSPALRGRPSQGEGDEDVPALRGRPSQGAGDDLMPALSGRLSQGTGDDVVPAISGRPSQGEGDDLMPDELAGWRKVGFRIQKRSPDDPFGGLVSHRWQYAKGNRTAVVSLDGPYSEWHDLAVCYTGIGWEIAEAKDVQVGGEAERVTARELRLTRLPLDRAHVLFACFAPDGRCLDPAPHVGGLWSKFAGRLRNAMQERPIVEGEVVQVQVLEETVGERPEEAAEEIRELFEEAVRQVAGGR